MDCICCTHFVNIASILFCIIICVISHKCEENIKDCSCIFSNGSIINLRPVAKDPGPRWLDILDVNKQYNYSFNPCIDFREGNGVCSSVAVCQSKFDKNTSHTEYYNLGANSDAHFIWNSTNQIWTLKYVKDLRTTQINLICSYSTDHKFLVIGENTTDNYFMNLISPCACADGCILENSLSTGSVLVILFFVLVGIYLLGGMCYMKIVRGASGKELIPNYDFWMDFPLLVRDGVVFICSGCRAGTTYERI